MTARSSDTANGPTIRRMRGKVLNVHAEHWWHRSSRCSNGDCLEVAKAAAVILVQDSKRPAAAGGSMQAWSVEEWQELLRAIRLSGGEDLPQHVALDFPESGLEHMRFGLDRHELLNFDLDEWTAFRDGVLAGEFEPERLSGPVSVTVDGAGREVEPNGDGSDQAAAGADGRGGQGLPAATPSGTAPVAAELQDSPAGRKPSTTEVGAVATTGQPGPSDPVANQEDASLIWVYDDDLGEPQDPGVDKGAARRAGQGPVFADRSGTEAAGTGTPPVLVPVADVDRALRGPWVAVLSDNYGELYETVEEIPDGTSVEIAVVRESALPKEDRRPGTYYASDVLYELDGFDFDNDTDEEMADRWVQAQAVARLLNGGPLTPVEDELLRQAAAPLVPTDGAS